MGPRSRLASIGLSLLLPVVAAGFVRLTVTGTLGDRPLRRTDNQDMRFLVNSATAAGLMNDSSQFVITSDSEPMLALERAIDNWDAVPDADLSFAPLRTTSAGIASDGVNVISFEDSPAIRALTVGAIALSLRTITPATGELGDCDIQFNPDFRLENTHFSYSTTLAFRTYDIQSIATHELGHCLGANHTPVVGAAMNAFAISAQNFQARLAHDDIAFAQTVYPPVSQTPLFGTIEGTLTIEGVPAAGVAVVAIEPDQGITLACVTDLDDGSYRLESVPAGRYLIYGEALDGPSLPRDFQDRFLSRFSDGFRPRLFGPPTAPTRVDIFPGRVVHADFNFEMGQTAFNIEQIGIAAPETTGRPGRVTTGPIQLIGGHSHDILLSGPGIDASVREDSVSFNAPGVTIRPGSLKVDAGVIVNGGPVLRMTVDIAPRTERQVSSMIIRKGTVIAVYTGPIAIEPGPSFPSDGFVNAASFSGRGISPGGIYSIFGERLGPTPSISVAGFDARTGRLPTKLGDVRVLFNNIPGAMFFAQGNQLNLQAPVEVNLFRDVSVVVEVDGIPSPPVKLPVVNADPGIFLSGNGGQAVVLNQDQSPNSLGNPTAREEVITIFGTGPGTVLPPVETGAPARGVEPFSRASAVQVFVGGVEIPSENILFAGMTPGLVGLFQVNVRIPASAITGSTVSLVITVRGIPSQDGATIAIQ
jgi:uncharacterized protein (TIGR03437 family)